MRRRLLGGCALATAALAPALAHAQLTVGAPPQVGAGGQAPLIVQTSRTTDITLNGPRTILNWSSYNLGADQAVVYRFQDRSWIALNKVDGQAVINGQLDALVDNTRGAGNVWFSAPGGVVFGAGARVNVGGLLATTAGIGAGGFLDSGTTSFAFTDGGGARVEVKSGAEIRSGGGAVVLAGESVSTEAGSSIVGTGAASITFGAAGDFTVRFAAQPGDLDLLDFVVPAGGGTPSTTPLSLQGQAVASNVFLAVVNRAEVASAVINAPGLLAAQSASTDRGDVVLTAGVGIVDRQPGATRVNSTTETTATFGVVSATRDVLGAFGQPTAVTATQLAGGRDMGISAAGLDAANLAAGRLLVADASRGITVRGNATAGSSATFRSTGALSVTGAINAVGRLQIDVGTLQAGQLNSGRAIVVNAGGAPATAGGAAVSIGSALADDDIAITTTNATGSIVLGQATLTGFHADQAPTGRNLVLTARGAQADITYGAATGSLVTGATNFQVAAGRDATLNVSGLLSLAGSSAGHNFTIRANDLDFTGPLTAANLRVESLGGALTIGSSGSGAPPAAGIVRAAGAVDEGLRVTDAEFQQIQVTGQAAFYAGSTAGSARGNLNVLNLWVNPARVPSLLLAAGLNNDVTVTGTLAPTTANGGTLTIGESDPASAFRPARILVTGFIGFSTGSPDTGYSAVRAFDAVNLYAASDVILGSQRFVNLVSATPPSQIDISANRPTGVAPTADERDHVFLTSGQLLINAPNRIVQENTGTMARPNGLFLTSQANTLAVNRAAVVDVYGAYRDRNGAIVGLFGATQITGTGTGEVRVNGCDLSEGGCGVAASTQKIFQPTEDAVVTPEEAAAAVGSGVPPEPPVLNLPEPDADEIVTDPVTLGTGSDELWKHKRAGK